MKNSLHLVTFKFTHSLFTKHTRLFSFPNTHSSFTSSQLCPCDSVTCYLSFIIFSFNSCVTNEKLISPFRGTYNTDDGHQVTLYAYLKAFRFTGSPALYLECDIHMCHNKCPVSSLYNILHFQQLTNKSFT